MKKLYFLLFAISFSVLSFGQTVTITRIIDGKAPSDGCAGSSGSSSPKTVELYVSGTIDFTGYTYELESNGTIGGVATWNSTDISALGSRTNEFVYICPLGETTLYDMYTGATAGNTFAGGSSYNGNDAIRITDGTNVLDQFGDPADVEAGDYSSWDHVDSYARRLDGSTPNGGTFVEANWFIPGGDYFDNNGISSCVDMLAEIQFGSFNPLSITDFNTKSFSVFPNPTNTGSVNVVSSSSANNGTLNVAVFDVLGKQVINTLMTNETLDVSSLNTGVYIMKITQGNATSTKKLVIN